MSFTADVKNELANIAPFGRHCAIAETAGLINGIAGFTRDKAIIKTETELVAKRLVGLAKEYFAVDLPVNVKKNQKHEKYIIELNKFGSSFSIAEASGIYTDGKFRRHLSSIVTSKQCCKRAYIRGAFLAAGNISNPDKAYHLEIGVKTGENAEELCSLLEFFDLKAKILKRYSASNYALYLKDSEQIAGFISVIGAVNAYLKYENARIFKDVINGVNRLCNCDAANIDKAVTAAGKQIEAINKIESGLGLKSLSEPIREAAILRKNNPELSLSDLGALFNPPLSKSGASHRMKKILEIANMKW